MKHNCFHGPVRDKCPCCGCEKSNLPSCRSSCKEHADWHAEVERVNQNRRDYYEKKDIGWRKK